MKTPKEIWIVFDPLDGPHLFTSRIKAWKTMDRWEIEAGNDQNDSYWDMTGPFRYVLDMPVKRP